MENQRNLTYGELIEKLKLPTSMVGKMAGDLRIKDYCRRLRSIEVALREHCTGNNGSRIPRDSVLPEAVIKSFEDFIDYHNDIWGDELGRID